MAGSVNKVILIGNLGNDPEIRAMQSGDKVCNLSIATSESWKDKTTGERRENTQWHKVVIFNQGIMTVCENYLKKGAKVYIEGQLETRSWEQDGQKKYTTEVVLRPYRGELTMLDSRQSSENAGGYAPAPQAQAQAATQPVAQPQPQPANTQVDELEDEIPF